MVIGDDAVHAPCLEIHSHSKSSVTPETTLRVRISIPQLGTKLGLERAKGEQVGNGTMSKWGNGTKETKGNEVR